MQVEATMAFLLPHECLAVIHTYSDVEVLSDRQELDKVSLEHLQQAEAASGQNLLALGLWGDGVPFTWARDQSMETWVWFLPGVGHETWKGARFPFTCFPTSSVGSTTQAQILEVFVWSLEAMFEGEYPRTRPGGLPWTDQDGWRKKRAGQKLGFQAILTQVKGDWKHFKLALGLPGWRDWNLRCWRCRALAREWQETGDTASMWQNHMRLNQAQLLGLLKQPLSPIWGAPCMSPRVIKIDWLHTVDKGVGVWFLGGIFLEVLAQPCYGGNQTQKLVRLWGLVRRFYADYGVADRLSRLNQNMIKNHLSSLGAAEARALIPFGVQMADDLCREVPGQAEIVTLRAAMGHLSECYQMLSKDRRADVEAGALRVQALAFHDLLPILRSGC